MIKAISVINSHKEKVRFELSNPRLNDILVTKVEGLGPPKATINTLKVATFDGSIFNSSKLEQRNIVIALRPLPGPDVESKRLLLYRMFPVKGYVTIIVETDHRTGGIEGYVESNEPDIFSSEESIQVSILCPDPYFKAYEGNRKKQTIFSPGLYSALLEFPFENQGTSPTIEMGETIPSGDTLVRYTGESITYPIFKFTFTEEITTSNKLLVIEKTVPYLPNQTQRMAISLSKCGTSFLAGDIIEIDCRPRHKTVKVSQLIGSTMTFREVYGAMPFTATVGGVTFNNDWPSIEYGDTSFSAIVVDESSTSTNIWTEWVDTGDDTDVRIFGIKPWNDNPYYYQFDIEFRVIGSSNDYWAMFISDNTDPLDSSISERSFSRLIESANKAMHDLYGGSSAVKTYTYDGRSTYQFSPKVLEGITIHIEANTTTTSFTGQVGSSLGIKRLGSGKYQFRIKGLQGGYEPLASSRVVENELPFEMSILIDTLYEGM